MNTSCNKLSINECGMIRQVFVVWFDSGGHDAYIMGLIHHPVKSTPLVQLTDHPHPLFLFIIANHEISNPKLQKCHVIYTITIQWKPGVNAYTHFTYWMNNVYFYGLK